MSSSTDACSVVRGVAFDNPHERLHIDQIERSAVRIDFGFLEDVAQSFGHRNATCVRLIVYVGPVLNVERQDTGEGLNNRRLDGELVIGGSNKRQPGRRGPRINGDASVASRE